MWVIYPDKINSVVATNENANYPVTNVIDDHPKKVYKGVSNSERVTLTMHGGSNMVGIANTNAVVVKITIMATDDVTVLSPLQTFDLSGIDTYYKFFTDSATRWYYMKYLYDYQAAAHKIYIDLEAKTGEIVEAGIITCGPQRNFKSLNLNMDESLKDYSLIDVFNNGAFWVLDKDTVRTFSGSFDARRATDFYSFMRDIIKVKKSNPLFWSVTDINEHDWLVFGRLEKMPVGKHAYRSHSLININILEVV